MITGIIGRKVGMTQVFAKDGTATPATVIKAGPCVVVQAKTAATDGYEAVQIGLVEERPARVRKPLEGHYKKAGVPPTRVRRAVTNVVKRFPDSSCGRHETRVEREAANRARATIAP